MDNKNTRIHVRMVEAGAIVVLLGILIAGLWPFHAPKNDVRWLERESGLRFGQQGSAVTSGAFRASPAQANGPCTLEIWLEPSSIGSESTIMAFDSSADHSLPFSLRQYGNSIAIQRFMLDQQGIARRPWLKVDGVFRDRKRTFVSITSGKQGTAVYADGILKAQSSSLGLLRKDMTGRLVLANSTVDDSWPGQILGLAIYDRELTSAQVARHFESWTTKQEPALVGEEDPVALYLFNESGGNIAHNRFGSGTDLTIPRKYFVLHPAFLRSTWDQYSNARTAWTRWSYWQDLAVNIAGFLPLGFVFSLCFSTVWRIRRPGMAVILMGFGLSVAIEALQWFLPTRNSSMTDVVTNTTGAAVGVLLYRSSTVHRLVNRFGCFSQGLVRGGTDRDLPSLDGREAAIITETTSTSHTLKSVADCSWGGDIPNHESGDEREMGLQVTWE